MNNKFACIHGHFYQPPRENPWLEAIEPEESATPYRDWNERIFDECYGPNAACPMIGPNGLIVDMADNYRKMSFNFGPTLLSWVESEQPLLYRRILEADASGAKENDGHGPAVAQPYYHAILPLQSVSDKRTLVRWGVQDFRARFRRAPEGMWLPETGVDEETLEVLAEEGLRFTILSPRQAARVRGAGSPDDAWKAVDERTLQPTRPYRWRSRTHPGRSLAIFFYHQSLHQGIVSGDVFSQPDLLCRKILARFHPDDSTQLVSAAADGEFFGHHHKAGAAALAQTFRGLAAAGVEPVSYAAFLARFPPPQEVEIRPRTAWSCEHELGRWTRDCGCRHRPDWKQQWRGPLRDALDWLARQCDAVLEREGGAFLRDFRAARDAYVPRPARPQEWLEEQARGALSLEARREALSLMEMQRHRLAMFTSCGWFFDDVSGLEASQCLKHAARAAELAARFGADPEPGLRRLLAAAPSNVEDSDGAVVYERLVRPCRFSAERATAQAALLSHIGWPAPRLPAWRCETSAPKRLEKTGLAGRDRSFCAMEARARFLPTDEELEARAFVYQRDRVDVTCWLSPEDAGGATFAALAEEFPALSDDEFLAGLGERLGGSCWKLDALCAEPRKAAWRLLMPGPGDEPRRRAYLKRWARALQRPGAEEVPELLAQAQAHGLSASHLPGVEAARVQLEAALRRVLEAPDQETFARLGRWLRALEAAGLPVSVWRLRFFFWAWRARILAAGPRPGEREAALALGERLGFSDAAMPFGRMAA